MASTATPVETVQGAERAGGRRGRVLRFIGKTCLTAAFILAAYIVWLLWGTGFYTARQQEGLRRQLEARIAERDPRPNPAEPTILPGRAYAILQIPSIDIDEVVVEGTDVVDLKSGPGHYADTEDPWDRKGRVGIAGHRTTYGAPFWDLDKVRAGDEIRLITELGTYDYRVTQTREVLPTAANVLRPSRQPSLVLTTCTPKFSAARRLIVFADLAGGSA
ncbi:MAG TPA: sortase [Actinomycetota bacterium]|nr:sortase [Actinomycetota bacterium]